MYSFTVSLALSLSLVVADPRGMPSPTVTTHSGRLRGRYMVTRGGRLIQAFLSIPFAKPPLGPLRFQPPQPVEPWTHERLAVVQPLSCAQTIDPTSVEDCLYLNVFTPDVNPKHAYPVIFFIFPGAFEVGGENEFTPEYLLDKDIVFVTVNHRLGLLGFLSTGDEVVPGNMGLKDVRLALRWVQTNIRSFGGDPDKVTLQGQSSGASAVHFLMTYTAHEGLFRAAISESGTALLTWAFHPPQEIRKSVKALALLSACPEDSEGFVECLRTRPVEELLLLFDIEYKGSVYTGVENFVSEFLPLVGGVIEPECVEDRFVTGNPWDYNTTTPWLVGINSKELLFIFVVPLSDQTDSLLLSFNALFDFYFPLGVNYQNSAANSSQVPFNFRKFYMDLQPISRATLPQFVDGLSDALINYGTYEAVVRANQKQTYVYYLDYVGINEIFPVPADARIGASHTDELFYLFPHPGARFPDRQDYLDPSDNALSVKIVDMWTNFATCLDPTPSGTCGVTWKPFYPNQTFLHFTQTQIFLDHHFLQERMDFWSGQPFPYRDDFFETPPCRGPYTSSKTIGSADVTSADCATNSDETDDFDQLTDETSDLGLD